MLKKTDNCTTILEFLHSGATKKKERKTRDNGLNQPNVFLVNDLETCLKFSPDKYHGCITMLH